MVTFTCAMAPPSPRVRGDDRANRFDGSVQPLRDVPVGNLEPTRTSGRVVEFGGKLCAVRSQRIDLLCEPNLAALDPEPALKRGLEGVERELQPLDRRLDRNRLGRLGSARNWLGTLHCHRNVSSR